MIIVFFFKFKKNDLWIIFYYYNKGVTTGKKVKKLAQKWQDQRLNF